jgi:hypothetical protein
MKVRHRRAHRRIWLLLTVVLAIGFATGIAVRQETPLDPTAIPPAEIAR